ncbi:MAG TPA: hypothetical protein VJJ76_02065 [archaeon]|nr:hypothetical protein [archaeon]
MKLEQIGHWSFILGVVIAIVAGLAGATYAGAAALLLVVLGIIIGFLNISEREVSSFLIAAIALLLTGAAGLDKLPAIGSYIGPILTNISTFVAPAAVIVALKAVFELGKRR